jgi:hypothetical protein
MLVVIVPPALLVLLVVFLVRRSGKKKAGVIVMARETPKTVGQHLEHLRDLRGRYLGVRAATRAYGPARAMAQQITQIANHTSELFRRLAQRGGGDQLAVAEVEYRDQLAKVAEVLGERYYLDILLNPRLWDDPRGRSAAVEAAVSAFLEQIIENIKQVNAAQDLRFQVSLDALARAKRDQAAGLYNAPDERPQP